MLVKRKEIKINILRLIYVVFHGFLLSLLNKIIIIKFYYIIFQNPPNILVQAELRTYVTPVVILPQDEPDGSQISSDLIDVSSESSQNCSRSMSPDLIAQRYENYSLK